MIKNIVFDIGNVLSKFNYMEHFRQFAKDENTFQRLLQATVLNSDWVELDRGIWSEKEIEKAFIKKDAEISAVIHQMYTNMKGIIKEYEYATDWVISLQRQGFKVFVLSNFSDLIYRTNKEEMKFLDVVDGGILSYQEHVIKPDAEIYELLVDKYQLIPEECVFLDDREENIEAAINLGWSGIVFQSKEQAEEELVRIIESKKVM